MSFAGQYLAAMRHPLAAVFSMVGTHGLFRALAGELFGGFVLAFHDLPGPRFQALVEALSPDEPIHLSDLVDRVRAGRSTRGLFAITVDDGLRDTVRALSAVATERHWPITCFVPTGYVGTGATMPFQWMERLFERVPRVRVALRSTTLDLSTDAARRTLERDLRRIMYAGPSDAYRGLITELVEHAAAQGWITLERDRPQPVVSWEDVAELARCEEIRFESHGVTHTAVSALRAAELERELRESQEQIQEHTGRPCRHFAYPFGSPESIGPTAASVVARYYESAVTMSRGRLRRRDPFLLPRIPLYARDSAAVARLKVLTR